MRRAIRADFTDMASFGRQVRDALAHLYDPAYLQTHPLTALVRSDPNLRNAGLGKALRQLLVEAIDATRPIGSTDSSRPASLSHQILTLHYVEGLEPARVQERLAVGRSEYYREHQKGVDAVVSVLWNRWGPGSEAEPARTPDQAEVTVVNGGAAPAARHNLPIQLTSFVGRAGELATVKHRLQTSRILTLTGSGGCGKTRLALKVAADLVDAIADGVWLVELAPLGDPVLLPQTIARTLGVQEEPARPILRTLLDFLGPRQVLLLVDNCEHLIAACAQLVETILQACPKLTILATSREALGIPGEIAWRVPSLTLPDEEQRIGAMMSESDVGASEAVQLFIDRARTADPRFDLTPGQTPAVVQICRRLDGIPLALELAAARLTVLSVEQIAARLDDRFRLLTGGSRTALPRQQTLRATLDWSYTLLNESERRILRRLAVFVSGCTLEAAEAVCSGSDIAESEVLDLLAQLVGKSLVVVDKNSPEPRYRLLETIRQYGWDRLVEAEEAQRVRERHLAWFLSPAEQAEPEFTGPRQREWLDRVEGEIDNLREALDWSMRRPPAEHALRLAGALGWLWEARDYWTEGNEWLARALALPENAARTAARAKALDFIGNIAANLDQMLLSCAAYEECFAICQEVGDRRRESTAAAMLVKLALVRREPDQATKLLADALTRARATGDRWSIARLLDMCGLAAFERRDDAACREFGMESAEHYRAVGDWRALGMTLLGLGRFAGEQGDFATARRILIEALELYRDLRMTARIILILGDLGIATWLDGDREGSETLLREAEALARATGFRPLINGALIARAFVARAFVARADADDPLARQLVAEAWKVTGVSERGLTLGGTELSRGLGLSGLLAIDQGDDIRGVRLLGAAERWCARWLSLLGEDRARGEALTVARARLGNEAVAAAYAEGQAMTLEQAVLYAQEEEQAK